MTLNGAMKDDIKILRGGYITILPVCDEVGRSIIYINKACRMPTTEEKLRVLWYLLHVATQNPTVRKEGYVVLTNSRGVKLKAFDPKFSSQAAVLCDRAFPIRWYRVHVCQANAVFPMISNAIKAILSKMQRQTFLLHNGSEERVLETLEETGVPRHCVPTDLGGPLQFSQDDFIRDRLIAEGGSLQEWDELVARDPSPSKDNHAVVVTNNDTNNNELLGYQFLRDPNQNPQGIPTGPTPSTSQDNAPTSIASHVHRQLENNRAVVANHVHRMLENDRTAADAAAIAQRNFAFLVQAVAPACAMQNSIGVEKNDNSPGGGGGDNPSTAGFLIREKRMPDCIDQTSSQPLVIAPTSSQSPLMVENRMPHYTSQTSNLPLLMSQTPTPTPDYIRQASNQLKRKSNDESGHIPEKKIPNYTAQTSSQPPLISEKRVPNYIAQVSSLPSLISQKPTPEYTVQTTQSSSSSSSRPKRKGNDNSKNNTSRKSRTKPSSKGDGSCKHGRNGNPLMNEAVKAKVNNPNLSLVAALMAGGFVFPDFNAQGISMSEVRDTDNVTLYQRRNQLLRRLRYMKGKGSKPK